MPSFRKPIAVLIAAASAGVSAHGALLVRESFDSYAAGANLGGGSIATDATGLTGNYKNNNFGTYTATSGGLAFSDYNTATGNKLSAPFTTGGTSLQATLSLSSTINPGDTLWSSYLVRYTSISSGTSALSEIRLHTTDAGTGTTSRFRSMGNSAEATGTTFAGIAYDSSNITATSGTGSSQLVSATTYMVLSSYTNIGSTGSSVATQWVLTEAQYENFRDSGFSISNLTSRTAGTGATNAFSLVSDTATSLGFTSGMFLQIAGNADQATYDEIRYATTLAEVVTAIPEPGSAVLALLGAFGLFRRRR